MIEFLISALVNINFKIVSLEFIKLTVLNVLNLIILVARGKLKKEYAYCEPAWRRRRLNESMGMAMGTPITVINIP